MSLERSSDTLAIDRSQSDRLVLKLSRAFADCINRTSNRSNSSLGVVLNPLNAVGFLAFFIVSLVVGVRLLLLWKRTRMLPELLIGLGVLGIGPVGFGGMIAGMAVSKTNTALGGTLFMFGFVAIAVGVLSKWIFNWRVYHPNSRALGGVVVLVGVILVAQFFYYALGPGFIEVGAHSPVASSRSLLQITCLLWGSVEALRFWRRMLRRSSLGLASPEVTNRFFLWGLGAASAGLGTAIGTVAGIVTGLGALEIPWVLASSSAHGFVAAIAMWLAFVPPAWYLRWISGASAKTAG